jgi:hypothetical protein
MLWAGGIRCIEVGTGQREIGDEDRQDGVWGVAYRPHPTRDRLLLVKTDTTNSKLEHDIWRKNCLLHLDFCRVRYAFAHFTEWSLLCANMRSKRYFSANLDIRTITPLH